MVGVVGEKQVSKERVREAVRGLLKFYDGGLVIEVHARQGGNIKIHIKEFDD